MALLVLSGPSKAQVVGLGIVGVLLFSGAIAAQGIQAPYTIGKPIKIFLLLLFFAVVMAPFCWIAWPQNRAHIHIVGFHRVQDYAPYTPNTPVQIIMAINNDGDVDAKMASYFKVVFSRLEPFRAPEPLP